MSFARAFVSMLCAMVWPAPGMSSVAATPAAAPLCAARQLTAADAGGRTFGERRVIRIELTNNSPAACALRGYPWLQLARMSGYAPDLSPRETPVDANYRTPGPAIVQLGSLEHASFLLAYSKVKTGSNACVPSSNIVVGGFARYGTVKLPDMVLPCGPLEVSPFFKGPAQSFARHLGAVHSRPEGAS
jgi:hypothetical protein